MSEHPYGLLSLLPPLAAILLADHHAPRGVFVGSGVFLGA
jgi:hypothetical protein